MTQHKINVFQINLSILQIHLNIYMFNKNTLQLYFWYTCNKQSTEWQVIRTHVQLGLNPNKQSLDTNRLNLSRLDMHRNTTHQQQVTQVILNKRQWQHEGYKYQTIKGVMHWMSSATSRTTRGIAHQTRTFYTNKLPEVCCNGCVLVNSVGGNRRQWM